MPNRDCRPWERLIDFEAVEKGVEVVADPGGCWELRREWRIEPMLGEEEWQTVEHGDCAQAASFSVAAFVFSILLVPKEPWKQPHTVANR